MDVLDYGREEAEGVWFAMPLAQGSLKDHIDSFKASPERIRDVMRQVCAGLAYVHNEKILHRDLKPGNILLTADGDWAISDFGLAVELEGKTTALTSQLQGFGTYIYSAPEQFIDAHNVDARADVYSLGKILQHMATGELPFAPTMPAGVFSQIVDKATSQQPHRRYQDVIEFVDAVERAVAAAEGSWETPEDTANRMLDRIRRPSPDLEDLRDLLTWSVQLNERDYERAAEVIPWLSVEAIEMLWRDDSAKFIQAYRRFAEAIAWRQFEYSFVDVIAEFCKRAVNVTGDFTVLSATTAALPNLGESHNRWHVRSVLTIILQSIRDANAAVAATEGLKDAKVTALHWALPEFNLRSLHPLLREGIEQITGTAQPDVDLIFD
jgi:serine/threonine protein kinase